MHRYKWLVSTGILYIELTAQLRVEQEKYLMKRPFRHTILALVFCLILIASFNILNRPSRDEKTFKMQAVEWIPIGTTVEAAKKNNDQKTI